MSVETTPLQGITLYSHADDFRSHWIRYVLAEKQIKYHLVLSDADDEDLASLNPYNQLPTLIENDLKLFSMYNIGLANMCLYFCERVGFKNDINLTTGRILDINKSIFYLRKSLTLMEKTIDIAPGLYLHQCIRTLEYIFSVFLNYNVDNNNIPVDLDSVYVFIDQLDNDNIWQELARQMKSKYNL